MSEGAWTLGDKDTLRQLFAAGLSTSEIGRKLSRTKNSIVGQINRLDAAGTLGSPRRPSPIKGSGRVPVIRACKPATITLAEFVAPFVVLVPTLVVAAPKPPPPPTPAPIPRREGGRQCEYLEGDEKPYVRCEGQRVIGGPYCERHMIISYPSWRKRDGQSASVV
jgi:hypothetical protein